MNTNRSLLLIYTGGTIGMKENPLTGALAPFNFEQIASEVPEVEKFGFTICTESVFGLGWLSYWRPATLNSMVL